jgi:apolipoprotein N-acyltransferase
MSSRLHPYLSLFGGCLLGLSFVMYPNLHLEFLAWIGFVPILLGLKVEEKFGAYFRKAYFAMLCFTLVSVWWVALSTPLGGFLMYFMQSLFNTVPLIIFFFVRKAFGWRVALWSLPVIWTTWEWRYLDMDISFGWITIGNSQANLYWLIQYADLFGVWGISFWILIFNVLITEAVEKALHEVQNETANVIPPGSFLSSPFGFRFIKKIGIIVLAMLAFPVLYSAYRLLSSEEDSGRSILVANIQPNIDPFSKWANENRLSILQKHLDYSDRALATSRPDLVVWPETAIPYFILFQRGLPFQLLDSSVKRWQVPLLTGFSDATYYTDPSQRQVGAKYDKSVEQFYDTFNAAMLVTPDGKDPQVYHKSELVPFAERVPYMEYFSFLASWTFSVGGTSSWGRGQEIKNFTFTTRTGTEVTVCGLICYESIYPDLVAQFVQNGATLLTVITNDGWFSKSYGPYQHAAFARLRCIETRRAMVRCANTGVSLFIDKMGRSYGEVPWWEAHTPTFTVKLHDEITFYVAHPDWFAKLCGILTLSLIVATFVQMFRKKMV